jgi:hypothetical protein
MHATHAPVKTHLDLSTFVAHTARMSIPVTIGGVTYPSQNAAGAALGLTKQAIQHRRKAGTATAGKPLGVGRPVTPVSALKRNAAGNVELRIYLPPRTVAWLDARANADGLRGRHILASRACLAGFKAMEEHPPKRHAPPGRERRRRAASDNGVKVELRPADAMRIERYADERHVPRNVVVAMAVSRGLVLLGGRAGT